MSLSRGSSDLFLVPLRNPHDRGERMGPRISADDDSHQPLIATPIQDYAMEVGDPSNDPGRDRARSGERDRSGGRFRFLQMPTPRRRSPGKVGRPGARLFERPKWKHLWLHVFLCIASYPVIYAGTILARDKSLFWARVIVGLWCAGVGVAIGWSLLAYASRFLEAASELQSFFYDAVLC